MGCSSSNNNDPAGKSNRCDSENQKFSNIIIFPQDIQQSFRLCEGIWYHQHDDIKKHYQIGSKIGHGSYASVKICTNRRTKMHYAVKCVEVSMLSVLQKTELDNEVRILAAMKHKSIVSLIEVFQFENVVYMVQELLQGNELYDEIVNRDRFSERDATLVVAGVASALAHCHKHGVVHRDLKPENVVFTSKRERSTVKLVDFGFATYLPPDGTKLHLVCGSPMYIAPEILLEDCGYLQEVDNWSLGVIFYILLAGFPPFKGDVEKPGGRELIFDQILDGKYDFPSPYWDSISWDAKKLISGLLQLDPSRRLTAQQVLHHQWMRNSFRPVGLDAAHKIKHVFRGMVEKQLSIPVLKRMPSFIDLEHGVDPSFCETSFESPQNTPILQHKLSDHQKHQLSLIKTVPKEPTEVDAEVAQNQELSPNQISQMSKLKSASNASMQDQKYEDDERCAPVLQQPTTKTPSRKRVSFSMRVH